MGIEKLGLLMTAAEAFSMILLFLLRLKMDSGLLINGKSKHYVSLHRYFRLCQESGLAMGTLVVLTTV